MSTTGVIGPRPFLWSPGNASSMFSQDFVSQACENGRGAILLSVARGKVSEGIDFGMHVCDYIVICIQPIQL